MTEPLNIEDYINTETAAAIMGVQPTTLHVWHSNGGGPHRIDGVRKSDAGRLEWPKTEVLRVAAERNRLALRSE